MSDLKVGRIEQLTHTPGPWDWFTNQRTREKPPLGHEPTMKFFIGADGQGFAHTVGLSEPIDTANARLIAAAPDLLAALKFIMAFYVEGQTHLDTEAWKVAHRSALAALAKAEGRS